MRLFRGAPDAVIEMLELDGALLRGHFRLLSGAHSDHFLRFSRIAREPGTVAQIADWVLPSVAAASPSIVVAPSTAGVALGWALASRLGVPLQLASLDDRGRATGLLGEPDVAGARPLLVNDVVTTGEGLRAIADVLRGRDANPVAATWFISRGPVDIEAVVGVPGFPVAERHLPAWDQDACPLCASSSAPVELALDLN